MKNVNYDFSSVHIDLPSQLAEEIILWGKDNISDDDIFVSQSDPTFGREDEMHATILYGIHSESPNQVEHLLADAGPITVKLNKIEIFTNPMKFDVVVIDVTSKDLTKWNGVLAEKVRHTNKYSSYRPHITVAYVKKGKGWKHRGKTKWEGEEFTADYVVFSSKNGVKDKIFLKK